MSYPNSPSNTASPNHKTAFTEQNLLHISILINNLNLRSYTLIHKLVSNPKTPIRRKGPTHPGKATQKAPY